MVMDWILLQKVRLQLLFACFVKVLDNVMD